MAFKKQSGRKSSGGFGARKSTRVVEDKKLIDVNDVEFLRRCMTEHGKINPARLIGASAKQQRLIKHGIRRARNMGLLA